MNDRAQAYAGTGPSRHRTGHPHTSLQLASWEIRRDTVSFGSHVPGSSDPRGMERKQMEGGTDSLGALLPRYSWSQLTCWASSAGSLRQEAARSPVWLRTAQVSSCFSSQKASSSQAGPTHLRPKASLIPPPPRSLLCLLHPQRCPCSPKPQA